MLLSNHIQNNNTNIRFVIKAIIFEIYIKCKKYFNQQYSNSNAFLKNPPVPAYSNEGGRPDFIRILILSGVQDDARPSSGVTGLCTDLIMIISDTPAIELHLD